MTSIPATPDLEAMRVRETIAAWLWQFNHEAGDGEPTAANRREADDLLEYLRSCRLSVRDSVGDDLGAAFADVAWSLAALNRRQDDPR